MSPPEPRPIGAAPDEADVLIVGGRCAGAPLATWLARAGASVVVADRSTFPSDTLSTHVFQGGAIAALRRLGVLEQVLATGAPAVRRGRVLFGCGDDVLDAEVPMPVPAPGLPAMLCVRRVALDEILHRAAAEAGAEMLDGWGFVDVVRDGGRVAGARLRSRDGAERVVRARLVVGADGRNSTVARQVGAGRYAVLPTERFGYFAYYEDVPFDDPPVIDIVRDERLYGFGAPADAGLYLACVMPPASDHAEFAADIDAGWEREVARLPRIGELVAEGRRAGRPRGLRPVDTFLREAAGRGWALLGDAGHFKDPSPGQGIADAMRQAERLAETITDGLGNGHLDRRLRKWWRWRDRDALERHAWAHAFGAAGPPPHVLVQAQRDALGRPDGPERFWGPSMQLLAPRRAVGPAALLRASARSVAGRRLKPTAAARELASLARRSAGYRRVCRPARAVLV
jgi:2-polyprenyl-6-methoxyphenol hydroxylase-like FAD-dependent oxidoreductase